MDTRLKDKTVKVLHHLAQETIIKEKLRTVKGRSQNLLMSQTTEWSLEKSSQRYLEGIEPPT